MLRFRIVLAVILFSLFAGVTQARSKHPTPSNGKNESRIPQTQTEHGQQPSAADQRGTEQSPVIVKIIGAEPKAQNPASDNPNNGKEKPSTDWWSIGVAGGTLVVLVLQLIAFTAQACYMRRTITEMQSTTRAAIRAAKAAENTLGHMRETAARQLRAYVFVKAMPITNFTSNEISRSAIVFRNSGPTPAYKILTTHNIRIDSFPMKEDFDFSSPPLDLPPPQRNGLESDHRG